MSSNARVDEGAGEPQGAEAVAPVDAAAPSSGGEGRGPTSRAELSVPSSGGMPRIPTYELLEEIGHGGMATVYRALDPRLGREVAVKVIHKHLRENTEVATRFVAEARAAAKLRHPNIVEVYDVSNEEDSERYLVVELLRGTTLRKMLIAHRDMPAEVGAAITLEICDALEHAHESNIIHRDIKPENVLVELPGDRLLAARATARPQPSRAGNEDGGVALADFDDDHSSGPRPTPEPTSEATSTAAGSGKRGDLGVVIKITDFGIAKILDAQGVTSTGQVLGSPAHMAPEQIEGGEVDARTDVFALGVLMYEALVGHLPFEGKNPAQVLRKVLDGIFPAADRERASVGGRWSRILAGALARDAAQRTASPGALAVQIRAELAALGITDPRAEVNAYFADPPGYLEPHHARLVPRLVTRAEAARKKRDVSGAAADFNRAAALAPGDMAILKRIRHLNGAAQRRVILQRAGVVVVATAAVALVTAGVTRWLRAPGADVDAGTPTVLQPGPEPPVFPVANVPPPNVDPSVPVPSTKPRTGPPGPTTGPTAGPGPTAVASGAPGVGPAKGTRLVLFAIKQAGARLEVDGREQRGWFGKSIPLDVGLHTATAHIENPCCESSRSLTFTVAPPLPDEPPEKPQVVQVSLAFKKSTVSLQARDSTHQMTCNDGLTVFGGGATVVTLNDVSQTFSCTFHSPDGTKKTGPVKVFAGKDQVVRWLE